MADCTLLRPAQMITDGDIVARRDAYATAVRAAVPAPQDRLITAGAGTWLHNICSMVHDVSRTSRERGFGGGRGHDDLLEPGLVPAGRWRPEQAALPHDVCCVAAVGQT
ncbi:hypothetical protein ACW2Q0_21320 [Nocardia sp. R16R-3T]